MINEDDLLMLWILAALAKAGPNKSATTEDLAWELRHSWESYEEAEKRILPVLERLSSDRPIRVLTNEEHTRWSINNFGTNLLWELLDKLRAELDMFKQPDELTDLQQAVLDALKKHCPEGDSVHFTIVAGFAGLEAGRSFSDQEVQRALDQLRSLGLARLKAPGNYAPIKPPE
jgi:hypothetical protein